MEATPQGGAFLRCAKIGAFKIAHPTAAVDSKIPEVFIEKNAADIDTERKRLWAPTAKVKHWSGLRLKDRVVMLKKPFEEVYEVKYSKLSWYTHADGLTGFGLKGSSYEKLASTHHYLAVQLYKVLLHTIIEEYQFAKRDSKILNKMNQAELMPFTNTDEDLRALERELLS